MTTDWAVVDTALADEVVAAVASARRDHPSSAVRGARLVDLHHRDMLVLWPTVTVDLDGVPPVLVEGSRAGDLLAAGVTATGGVGGSPWPVVFTRWEQALAQACSAAAARTGVPVTVEVPGAEPPRDLDSVDHYLPGDGPLDYTPLIEALTRDAALDAVLAQALSPDTVRPIGADDVDTALAALSSEWASVRRHASIVLLSVHL